MNWNGFTVLSSLHRPELNQFPNIALPVLRAFDGTFPPGARQPRGGSARGKTVCPVLLVHCRRRRDGVCSRLVSLQNPQG